MLEVQKSTLDMAGAARLDQLRSQLHPELAAQQPRSYRRRHRDHGRPATPAALPNQQT